jgi:hypothetical protein
MRVLTGEQVAEMWPVIKTALKLSAAPTADTNEHKLTNIYRTLLSGLATCFMTGNKRRPRTVVVVTMSIEAVSLTKNLLIYCAHGFEKEKSEEYERIVHTIKDFAKEQKCDNVICYVWNEKLKELFQKYGAECNYTLAVFPLN